MKRRIALWAVVGFAVACAWIGIAAATNLNDSPALYTLAKITSPPAILGQRVPLAYYWYVLLNAGTYAVVGLIVETLRRLVAPPRA